MFTAGSAVSKVKALLTLLQSSISVATIAAARATGISKPGKRWLSSLTLHNLKTAVGSNWKPLMLRPGTPERSQKDERDFGCSTNECAGV
jgi:hypothetical protein